MRANSNNLMLENLFTQTILSILILAHWIIKFLYKKAKMDAKSILLLTTFVYEFQIIFVSVEMIDILTNISAQIVKLTLCSTHLLTLVTLSAFEI